jgi:hypothetical protein
MTYSEDTTRITKLHDTIKELRAEIERVRALVRTAIPFMNDAGNDEDPDAKTVACAWLEEAHAVLEPKL